jgi:hypothetical protein
LAAITATAPTTVPAASVITNQTAPPTAETAKFSPCPAFSVTLTAMIAAHHFERRRGSVLEHDVPSREHVTAHAEPPQFVVACCDDI